MYDSVYTGFNLDMDGGRGVQSGNGQTKRGLDFGGYIWPRFRESVDLVFTSRDFPY